MGPGTRRGEERGVGRRGTEKPEGKEFEKKVNENLQTGVYDFETDAHRILLVIVGDVAAWSMQEMKQFIDSPNTQAYLFDLLCFPLYSFSEID